MTTLLFDVETNGFLSKMDRIHCLVIRDVETRETWRFRRHDASEAYEVRPLTEPGVLTPVEHVDDIAQGVEMLMKADRIVGHNIIAFDIPAIRKLFPDFYPQGEIIDSLVMTRLLQPDIKNADFRLHEQGRIPGQLIGSHSLDAWGYRVGLNKGSYAKDMERAGKNPWAAWNMDMEDYCVNDVDVNEILWAGIVAEYPTEQSVDLEHRIHDLASVMERNGYFFDKAEAEKLTERLQKEFELRVAEVKPVYGRWLAPAKKKYVQIEWDDPKGFNRKKWQEDMMGLTPPHKRRKYFPPNPEYGEDDTRAVWGEVIVPKKTIRPKGKPWRTEGAPYCPAKWVEFNPTSRPQIIDRFVTVHNWQPTEFTDKGNPEVSDGVLRALVAQIPMAGQIAEILYLQKLLGYLSTGEESWTKVYNEETERIHPYTNTGGTVSGRCSHNHPNIAQVPAVQTVDVKNWDGTFNPKILGSDGKPLPHCFKEDGTLKKKVPLFGRAGEYGWECRSLFFTPRYPMRIVSVQKLARSAGLSEAEIRRALDIPWVQVGVDLSGIEFRCLAELCAEFDGGELIKVVLEGDIHAYNQEKTGIASRDIVKRVLYGLMYGAGDPKLGEIVEPTASQERKRALGRELRATLMAGLPALRMAIEKVQSEAERGYLIGLDGRRLKVRSKHSALNLRLQSNAALIAKEWAIRTEAYCLDEGLDHGWAGDFAMLAFVHDELQCAVKEEYAQLYAQLCVEAARDAGLHYGFRCPVDAEAKFGQNWAECH